MIILNCSFKLQLLEGVLKRSLPLTLPVYGAVMHINRGNPAQHEVVVDSWPEFKVVLTRPHKKVVKDSLDFYANLHAVFYKEIDACQALLDNTEAIDWSKAFQLQGLQDGMYEAARDIAEARHVHLKPYHYQTVLHPSPLTSCESRLKSIFLHVGILRPSHANLLNETWSIGGNNRSLRYLESLIRYFPNACLMDKEGQLVSWNLSDPLACLTHVYTLSQYRGQGCAEVVTLATAKKMHACGFPIYGGTLPQNQAVRQSLRRQGFHFLPWTKYVLFFTPAICLKK
ncbi:glycine N-acyltransferase-like protein 3 [Eublepharis macularius]|uniref:Glycine N-acyltransferase-like protein n=1 Tax=Eublepharis macularius TaxID=481883 RepID=A0AA97IY85_EUBMA|nr:glycine N-acyltransferase-like protein 3 [Eublepharis macularius]XP_054827819.1 glycine N-acyltransferase-like protein 3 [Eublepharis macularius]